MEVLPKNNDFDDLSFDDSHMDLEMTLGKIEDEETSHYNDEGYQRLSPGNRISPHQSPSSHSPTRTSSTYPFEASKMPKMQPIDDFSSSNSSSSPNTVEDCIVDEEDNVQHYRDYGGIANSSVLTQNEKANVFRSANTSHPVPPIGAAVTEDGEWEVDPPTTE
eukprot:scaffold6528_cov114-Cylindrotheca_fusiformis.AAC.16